MILKIFLTGLYILVGAILVNMIAKFLKISTWYDFLTTMQKKGFSKTMKQLKAVDVVFLFLLYPLLLGWLATL